MTKRVDPEKKSKKKIVVVGLGYVGLRSPESESQRASVPAFAWDWMNDSCIFPKCRYYMLDTYIILCYN